MEIEVEVIGKRRGPRWDVKMVWAFYVLGHLDGGLGQVERMGFEGC